MQSLAQGFPSSPHTDGMGLEGPANHSFVPWSGWSNPERTYSTEETLTFFLGHTRLPEMKQRRRPPRGQCLKYPLGAINGLQGTHVFATQKTNDAMITPSEIRGCRQKSQRLF